MSGTGDNTMRLGQVAEISLAVGLPTESQRFLEKLGFRQVDAGRADARLYSVHADGRVYIGLYRRGRPFPALSFFTPDPVGQIAHLESLGIKLDVEEAGGGVTSEVVFTDPGGLRVRLAMIDGDVPPQGGESFALCGTFAELSIPTRDMQASRRFWEQLGFRRSGGDDERPYPWAIMSDGVMTLGLHQTEDFRSPKITYFAEDMALRIKKLKRRGVHFDWEGKDERGSVVNAATHSPEGQAFSLFTGSF